MKRGLHDDAKLGHALANMSEALLLLDASGCPADIGAHLDLSIQRLRQHLGTVGQSAEVVKL